MNSTLQLRPDDGHDDLHSPNAIGLGHCVEQFKKSAGHIAAQFGVAYV